MFMMISKEDTLPTVSTVHDDQMMKIMRTLMMILRILVANLKESDDDHRDFDADHEDFDEEKDVDDDPQGGHITHCVYMTIRW